MLSNFDHVVPEDIAPRFSGFLPLGFRNLALIQLLIGPSSFVLPRPTCCIVSVGDGGSLIRSLRVRGSNATSSICSSLSCDSSTAMCSPFRLFSAKDNGTSLHLAGSCPQLLATNLSGPTGQPLVGASSKSIYYCHVSRQSSMHLIASPANP